MIINNLSLTSTWRPTSGTWRSLKLLMKIFGNGEEKKKVKERENLRRWVWSESDRENRSR